jgi:hypothetical protein
VIRPFLKDKTKDRIKMHGSNLSELHAQVCRAVLPPELGGDSQTTFNPLDWYHTLLESSQTTTSPRSYFITQSTIYAKSTPVVQSKTTKTPIKALNKSSSDPAKTTLLGIEM